VAEHLPTMQALVYIPSTVKKPKQHIEKTGQKSKSIKSGLAEWLKWYSACFVSMKPSSNPSPTKKKLQTLYMCVCIYLYIHSLKVYNTS
jgi:hypothetical protein